MARPSPPQRIEDAVHIIRGDSAAGSLTCCGGTDLVVLYDLLFPGPCDSDPARHLEKRRGYLATFMDGYAGPDAESYRDHSRLVAELLLGAGALATRLSGYPEGRPVVLWTASSWPDRLASWWVLDALQRASLDPKRFWVAEPALPRGQHREHYHPMLGEFSPQEHQAAFTRLRPLGAGEVRAGAALWGKFASPSPLDFDRARRKGSAPFPDLALVAEVWGAHFPRIETPSRLRLSVADQALLEALRPDRWLRPRDVITSERPLNFRVIDCFPGDACLARRLREWAAHSPGRSALLERQEATGRDQMDSVAYRLTPRGERLRQWGLEDPDEAPALFAGGCRLYGTGPAWVRRDRGPHWRIEGLGG